MRLQMLTRLAFYLVSAVLLFTNPVALAQPPLPYVPPDLLDERRRISQTELRFCVWEQSPLKEFEVRIATEVAHTLLLEPIIHEIDTLVATNDADFWENMYTALTNDCEALMGYILIPEQLPVWMTASRPYYASGSTLAVTDPDIESLADVPSGEFVGSMLATLGDFQFLNYLQTLPADRRWRRLPFDTGERMIERLQDGTLTAALIQQATLYGVVGPDPEDAGIYTVSTSPLNVEPTLFAVGMRSSEASLRSFIDDAIVALIEDGVIQSVLEEMGMPGSAGGLGR